MTEDDWTRWGDAHPILSALAQLGIYALCWIGFLACFVLVAFLFALIGRYGP